MNDMNVEDKLSLLAMASKFEIINHSASYEVRLKESSNKDYWITAFYEDGCWNYYMSGVYNCGLDYVQIDLNEFGMLSQFCNLLVK